VEEKVEQDKPSIGKKKNDRLLKRRRALLKRR
jgi:hypothetical protein